ncbi:dihydrolipoamide acetyltransferase family protein [Jeotgalibacillus campisalis]|uniref:Dihydrolipoamide acetyltransferase component of pyruvate dehydrogenase complex n=1 Tax=Jeotgalibacillus campisalis TaxID=220754 RepID=A0A0C2VEZ5_9BACL|nr:dihydrolipoamide acetyltransferase family protein [Jeotgalibacillus campisalis]KIL47472.1 dihydrolipoyllysine acetyltransferase [Jeotgalibacillus campisalis]
MEIKLHDIGEGMTQAELNHYFVKPGDKVNADDPLVEVQTDKMTAEIPSPASGIVKELIIEPGSTIPVGTTIMLLDSPHSTNQKQLNTRSMDQASVNPSEENRVETHKKNTDQKRILASPYTRKIARDHQILIQTIKGSGPAGRITDADVYSVIENEKSEINQASQPIEENTQKLKNTLPYTGIRKQIGKKVAQTLFTVPHCTHFEEIDVTEILQLKDQVKREGQSISATIFFIKALSICLKEFPVFNSSLDEQNGQILLHNQIHMGLAVNTSDGLLVPVLKNVPEKSFRTLQTEMKDLHQKAENRTLSMAELKGSTFTISNAGPLGGSTGATPILNAPESALMAFHKIKKRPMVNENDEIVIRSMMNISMTYDHRIIDGGSAIAFTNHFAELIEQPLSMMVEL